MVERITWQLSQADRVNDVIIKDKHAESVEAPALEGYLVSGKI